MVGIVVPGQLDGLDCMEMDISVDLFAGLQERRSDSPYVESVRQARVQHSGSTIRPAEIHWHLVLARYRGEARAVLAGPLSGSGVVWVPEGAEIVWIQLKLGTFMPHLPTRDLRDVETTLPESRSDAFWLHGSSWPFPDYENVDTFMSRLAAEQVLVHDPLVPAVLQGRPPDLSARTIRHRFLRATGMTHGQVLQYEQAQRAAALLEQRASIQDAVYEAGYADQPHLTRALKRWIGHTPGEILRARAMAAIAV
jgi:hypothetical protein